MPFDEIDTIRDETFDSELDENRSVRSSVGSISQESEDFSFECREVAVAESHHPASNISPATANDPDAPPMASTDDRSLAQWQVRRCRTKGAKWGCGAGVISGIVVGVAIGTTVFPGVGTAIGAGIGAFLGCVGLGTLIGGAVGHWKGRQDGAAILRQSGHGQYESYSPADEWEAFQNSRQYWTQTILQPFGADGHHRAHFAADCAQQLICDRNRFTRAHPCKTIWNDAQVPTEVYEQFHWVESEVGIISQEMIVQRERDAETAAEQFVAGLLSSNKSDDEALVETTETLLAVVRHSRAYTEARQRAEGRCGPLDETEIHADLDRFLQLAIGKHAADLAEALPELIKADSAFRNLSLAVRTLKDGGVMPQASSLVSRTLAAVLPSSDSIADPELRGRLKLFEILLENGGTAGRTPRAVEQLLFRMPKLQFFLDAMADEVRRESVAPR